jgi:hypothetical protein
MTKKIRSPHTHKEREPFIEHMMRSAMEAILNGDAACPTANVYAKDKTICIPLLFQEWGGVAMGLVAASLIIYEANSYTIFGSGKRKRAELMSCAYTFRDSDISTLATSRIIRKKGRVIKFGDLMFSDVNCGDNSNTNLFDLSKCFESDATPERRQQLKEMEYMIERIARIIPKPSMH